MPSTLELDLILPCYNPIKNWEQVVVKSYKKLQTLIPDSKIKLILVNDGSACGINEKGIELLESEIPNIQIEHLAKNMGKGYAIRHGLSIAKGNYQIYTDIDFPYLETDVVKLYKKLHEENADIAIGYREAEYYDNVPKARIFISKLLRAFIKHLLKLPTTDTQSGLKGFNKNGKAIMQKTSINRYLFDLEFLVLASKQKNLKIATIPVNIKETVHFSSVSWKILYTELFNFLKIFFLRIF